MHAVAENTMTLGKSTSPISQILSLTLPIAECNKFSLVNGMKDNMHVQKAVNVTTNRVEGWAKR